MYYQTYLMHYGVPGMKWGVKKSSLKTMSRSERKAAKAKYKQNLKDNRNQYYKARKKANQNYEKNISEYTKASDKMNKKFDRDSNKIEKTHNDYADKVSMFGGNSAVAESIRSNIKTSEMNKKSIVEGKRSIAQEALDEKYSAVLDKANKKYSKEIKSARNTYKENKNKIKSGTYK